MTQQLLTKGFSNGQFTEISTILISIDNTAVNRGYGAFDFFGVLNKKAFYLDRHLDRFFRTLELLKLSINFSREEVISHIETVIQLNNATDFYIKLFALPLNSDSTEDLISSFYIMPVTMSAFDEEVYLHGGNLITKEYSRFLPEAKSTNYFPLIYWRTEISNNKAVDVLYYHNNFINETSRGNIFLVKNNRVYTPSTDILKGITRSIVIDILKGNNSVCVENQITLTELFDADEVFLSSTTKKILPIVKIDNKIIGNGKVGKNTAELMEAFREIQNSTF